MEAIEGKDTNYNTNEPDYTYGVAWGSNLIVMAGQTGGRMKYNSGSSSFVGDGNSCEYGECTTDAWVAAFNTQGQLQWGRQYSTGRPVPQQAISFNVDTFRAVAVNSDQVWAVGFTTNALTGSNQGGEDVIRAALYASTGNEINTFQEGTKWKNRAKMAGLFLVLFLVNKNIIDEKNRESHGSFLAQT